MKYVILDAEGKIVADVVFSETCCFFGKVKMFENGSWKEREDCETFSCIQASIYESSKK